MKKASIFMVIAAAASMASCTAQAPKADLKNDCDSLSYAFGLTQTQGFKDYLTRQLGVDTIYINEVIKGIVDGANGQEVQKQTAYVEGVKIGQMIAESWVEGLTADVYADDSTKSIDKNNLVAGFIDGTLEQNQLMTAENAREYVQTVMEAANEKRMQEQYGDHREAGE